MNAKDFLQAMNEIDGKYIEQADIFAPAAPAKSPVIFRALRWAGAAAACVLVAGGLWLMWDLGLLADINQVPASQGAEDRQNIRPGEPTPLSELPVLDFPTESEVRGRGGEAIGCGPELAEKDLTEEQIAAIWGQDGDIAWEGLRFSDTDNEYTIDGTAFYNTEGKLAYVSLNVDLDSGCSFIVEIAPKYINSLGSHMVGPPSRICDVWGTDVTTLAAYDAEQNTASFSISFLTGPEGEEGTLGLMAQSVVSGDSSTTWTQEDAKELLTRLASQCLRPGNVFDLSHLETAENMDAEPVSSAQEAEKEYKVRIDSEGCLYADGDFSAFLGGVHSAFHDGQAVLTGDDAVSNAADDSCIQVLNLDLPLVLMKDIEPAEGELNRELCALYSVGYGFFERDGEKIIKKVTGYGDVAGVITTPRGGAVNYNAWYPKDGSQYLPSIVEFIGGDESAAEEAAQQAHDWPEKAKVYAEKLLASYMEQNGMTGWKMKTIDKDMNEVLTPFGPQDGDLEETAKAVAQQYVDSWLSMSELGYPPLAECFYTDLNWVESVEPDSDIQVSCKMVFRLNDPDGDLGNWSAGNTKPGTGEYEGYYTAFRFIYAKQENGRWVITGSGTGP